MIRDSSNNSASQIVTIAKGEVLGASTSSTEGQGRWQGQVLGASTSSCGLYLNGYIKLGANNNKLEVEELQAFLNSNLGISLPITGYYGPLTYNAVKAFQLKYSSSILSPWASYGLADLKPTGYVYKTTLRLINLLMCSTLNLPMPSLP